MQGIARAASATSVPRFQQCVISLQGATRGDNWKNGPLVSGRTVLLIHSDCSWRQREVKVHLRVNLILCCHPVATIITAFPVDGTQVQQGNSHSPNTLSPPTERTHQYFQLHVLCKILDYIFLLLLQA